MNHNDWDTEEVLAFVHDVRPWRDMDKDEKAEWVRRVKHIRDNVTTGGEPWTMERLAGMFGLKLRGLEDRISRSEAISDPRAQQNSWADRKTRLTEEAAAKARAEEAAAAEKRQEAALARQAKENEAKAKREAEAQEKAKQDALKKAQREQELKHEANIQEIQKRMKAEADAESAKKLAHIEELLRAQIAAEPPTPEVLAQMAQQALASDDPNIVQKMADAYGEHVAKRLAEELRTKKQREAAAKAAKAERDAAKAAARHSLEYEDSALRIFNDGYDMMYEAHVLKNRKEITHSNLVASGLMFGEMLDRCQTLRDIADEMETAIKNAAADQAIEEAMADVTLDEN